MFSLQIKHLFNNSRFIHSAISPCFFKYCYCKPKLMFKKRSYANDLRHLLLFRSSFNNNNLFPNLCHRGLITARPKREGKKRPKTDYGRKDFKRLEQPRRPVPFAVADFIYTLHGISDSSSLTKDLNNSQIISSGKTEPIRVQRPTTRSLLESKTIDFKMIDNKILLQFLNDEVSSVLSSTNNKRRISKSQLDSLENAFVYKLKELSIHEMFSVARCFLLIRHRAPRYLTALFESVDNNFERMMSTENNNLLSRISFYIYFHGSCPESLLQKIEIYLSAHLDGLSFDEIGLACLGYFRANRRIRSFELLDRIAEKTLEGFSNLQPHHIIHTLKSFRHAGYSKISYFERLADLLVVNELLKDMTLNQVMHIIMAFASTKIYHPVLVRQCIRRSVDLVEIQLQSPPSSSSSSPSLVRTKELGRIVWAVGTLGVDDEDISKVKTLINAHTRIEMLKEQSPDVSRREYPESISDTVMGAVFLKIFPRELISLMLEEKTVNILQDLRGLEKKMQLLFIHHTVNIECDNYSGPKLKQFLVEQFQLKDRSRAIHFELDTRPGLLLLIQELSSIFGETKVHCNMILPHFTTADIEIHVDDKNRPVPFVPETLATNGQVFPWNNQKHITCDLLQMLKNPAHKQTSNTRIAIVIAGHNQCALNQDTRLLGFHRTKIRQLSALGYQVLLLMPTDIDKLKNEPCTENRKEWIFQNVIQKLNINCDQI